MAIFSHIQHPWSFTFGILGNIISFMVFLAPIPTFYTIIKKKSTEGFQSIPYVVALFSSMIWIYYATLKSDAILLITINVVGCLIETVYVAIYIAYAPKKIKIQTIKLVVSLNMVGFGVIAISTHYLAEGESRVQILGWICLIISVSVFAAPLSIMKRVIGTKSVEYMPFGLSFFLALSAVMWFFYGLLQKDFFVALPNIIGFVLGVIQMVLYVIYKNYNKKSIDSDNKLPISISNLEAEQVCDLSKCDQNKETDANNQSTQLQCGQEMHLELTDNEPPLLVSPVQSISSFVEDPILPIEKVITNCHNTLEASISCTSIVQPINAPGCNIFEDHNQKKSMEASNEVYLIESAA